jgi:hypothetical protein
MFFNVGVGSRFVNKFCIRFSTLSFTFASLFLRLVSYVSCTWC